MGRLRKHLKTKETGAAADEGKKNDDNTRSKNAVLDSEKSD